MIFDDKICCANLNLIAKFNRVGFENQKIGKFAQYVKVNLKNLNLSKDEKICEKLNLKFGKFMQ